MTSLLRPSLLGLSLLLALPVMAQRAEERPDDIVIPIKKVVVPEEPSAGETTVPIEETPEEVQAAELSRAKRRGQAAREEIEAAPERPVEKAAEPAAPPPAEPSPPPPVVIESRPIVPPPANAEAALLEAWGARRKAAEGRNLREVTEADAKIARLRSEVGWENLFAIGGALTVEAEGLLERDAAEALRRAQLAISLAPDLPAPYWTAARAALKAELSDASRWSGFALEAVKATWREPRWRAAATAELATALLGSFLLAAAALVLLVFLRHARAFLHDFHHLFPGAWRVQSAAIALLLVAAPLWLGQGPFLFLVVVAAAAWLYMGAKERTLVAGLLVVIGFAPAIFSFVERTVAFSGTRAELLHRVERGGPDDAPIAQLRAWVARPDAPYEAVFTLGRHARRHGRYDEAVGLLKQAVQMRASAPEAQVELGNALILAGDADGGRGTFEKLLLEHPHVAEAHFNLARILARRAQIASAEEGGSLLIQSQEHARDVHRYSPELGSLLTGEVDLRANRFLVGSGLPRAELLRMAAAQAGTSWFSRALSARLFGPIPHDWVWAAGLASLALLLVIGLLGGVVHTSSPCTKCGQPVCKRCMPEAVGVLQCPACAAFFSKRAAHDPEAFVAKEAQLRRHHALRTWALRALAVVVPGGGQAGLGSTISAFVLLLAGFGGAWAVVFREGLVRAPWGGVPAIVSVAAGVLVAGLAWLGGLMHVIGRTGGPDPVGAVAVGPAKGPAKGPAAGTKAG